MEGIYQRAHPNHSDRMYALDTTVTLEGVVREFQYSNPHAWLIVDVENDDGKELNPRSYRVE